MRILALDTTAPTAAAAIVEDGGLKAAYTLQTTTHSTTLLPMIESMLQNAGLAVRDMDVLAVSAGPGSFTGVRIGVSTVKGMAFADAIPSIGVSSLAALAWNLTMCHGIACPAINARRNQVYTAFFAVDGVHAPVRLTEDMLLPVAELPRALAPYRQPVYCAGDGYMLVEKELSAAADVSFQPTSALLLPPNGCSVALAAVEIVKESGGDLSAYTPAALAPLYLRKSQAEREREEKMQSSAVTQ